jgi:hypothetical protein
VNSIIILEKIQSQVPNYFDVKFYLMLNYYKLGWWESSLKIAEEIMNIANDHTFMIIIKWVICKSKLNLDIDRKSNIEIMKNIRMKNGDILQKFKLP